MRATPVLSATRKSGFVSYPRIKTRGFLYEGKPLAISHPRKWIRFLSPHKNTAVLYEGNPFALYPR